MRYILHSDLNNFYASCECLRDKKIRNSPVVVVGDEEKRHGIVLSKNEMAKAMGIKTGDTVWEARIKANNNLMCVGAHFDYYQEISVRVKNIYRTYSDFVESFGIDEAWVDITPIAKNFEKATEIANEIRKKVLQEIGISVSIGVSYNKVFAKLGSDLKKPNAVTVITPDNYQTLIWPCPVENLLYVGRATKKTLNKAGIFTIGELAKTEVSYLKKVFGVNGVKLYEFANGLECSEVKKQCDKEKSIGNSATCPRDLKTEKEVIAILYILAENVVKRMRQQGLWCCEVSLFVRDATLFSFERQRKLFYPTNNAEDIVKECMKLFKEHYNWNTTVRALGVRASKFCNPPGQLNFLVNQNYLSKQTKIEETVEGLRKKFGYNIIKRGIVATDAKFMEIDPSSGGHAVMYKF